MVEKIQNNSSDKKENVFVTLDDIRRMSVEKLNNLVESEGKIFIYARGMTPLKITRAELS